MFAVAVVRSMALLLAIPALPPSPPPPPQGLDANVVIRNADVVEGDAGKTPFSVEVELVGGTTPVDVVIDAIDRTATAGVDYEFAPAPLKLVPGVPQTVGGFVLGDTVCEMIPEAFALRATSQTSGVTAIANYGTVTIHDDDEARAPRFSIEDATVPEGGAEAHAAEVRITAKPAPQAATVVRVTPSGGRPYSPLTSPYGDYDPTTIEVTFPAGATEAKASIALRGDDSWEADDHVSLVLAIGPNGLIDRERAELVITNDDAPTIVTLDDVRVDEGDRGTAVASVRLRFDPPTPRLATFDFAVVGGTAREGEDFAGNSQTLYPAPGSTSMTVGVNVLGDTKAECDEGVVVTVRGHDTGDDVLREGHVLIVDDDGPRPASCPDPFATRSTPVDGGASDADVPVDAGAEPSSAGGCGCALGGGGAAGLELAVAALLVAWARRRAVR